MARGNRQGNYTVGDDKRVLKSRDAAISLATSKATAATEDVTFYVREVGIQGACARVSRVGSTILTEAIR